MSDKRRIALCLSGGGLRATFFHIGVVRALRRRHLLSGVTHIYAVSGGSILAAHLVLNWHRYTGSIREYMDAEKELLELGSRDIRGRILRRWLLSCLLPFSRLIPGRFNRNKLLEKEYARLYRDATLIDIRPTSQRIVPILNILATSFTTGQLCSFSSDGFRTRRGGDIKLYPRTFIPLGLAVAASSAFPPLFPPVPITRRLLDTTVLELPYDSDFLTDGGIYDNTGFEYFVRSTTENAPEVDHVILSDASAQFDWDIKSTFSLIVSRTIRATDILMKRVSESTIKGAISPNSTQIITHISIDTVIKEELTDDVLPVDVQLRMPKIRTDLNIFSFVEQHALISHGYNVGLSRIPAEDYRMPKEAGAIRLPEPYPPTLTQPLSFIISHLNNSHILKQNLFNRRDWTSFALVAWVVFMLAAISSPFILEYIRLSAKSVELDETKARLLHESDRLSLRSKRLDKLDQLTLAQYTDDFQEFLSNSGFSINAGSVLDTLRRPAADSSDITPVNAYMPRSRWKSALPCFAVLDNVLGVTDDGRINVMIMLFPEPNVICNMLITPSKGRTVNDVVSRLDSLSQSKVFHGTYGVTGLFVTAIVGS